MSRPGRFDAVIFDCDGVLVDSEGISEDLLAEMTAELAGAGSVDRGVLRRLRGERFMKGVRRLEEALGRPLPPGFEDDFRSRSRRRFQLELKPIPGVVEVLHELRIPFCVASNGPRDKIELTLGITGLLPRFDGRIFSAYELDVWKPDPRFYVEVARELGLAADRCVVVEDSAPGVRAALGAGMTVFAFAGGDDSPPALPAGAHLFREMGALPDLLAAAPPPPGT